MFAFDGLIALVRLPTHKVLNSAFVQWRGTSTWRVEFHNPEENQLTNQPSWAVTIAAEDFILIWQYCSGIHENHLLNSFLPTYVPWAVAPRLGTSIENLHGIYNSQVFQLANVRLSRYLIGRMRAHQMPFASVGALFLSFAQVHRVWSVASTKLVIHYNAEAR